MRRRFPGITEKKLLAVEPCADGEFVLAEADEIG